MILPKTPPQRLRRVFIVVSGALAALLILATADGHGQQKMDVLRIGTSGNFSSEKSSKKEKGALGTLKDFIKEETGLTNEIIDEKDWQTLAEKMAKGKLELVPSRAMSSPGAGEVSEP